MRDDTRELCSWSALLQKTALCWIPHTALANLRKLDIGRVHPGDKDLPGCFCKEKLLFISHFAASCGLAQQGWQSLSTRCLCQIAWPKSFRYVFKLALVDSQVLWSLFVSSSGLDGRNIIVDDRLHLIHLQYGWTWKTKLPWPSQWGIPQVQQVGDNTCTFACHMRPHVAINAMVQHLVHFNCVLRVAMVLIVNRWDHSLLFGWCNLTDDVFCG